MDTWIILLWGGATAASIFGGIGFAIWYERNKRKLVNQKISDQTVIELARANGGKINVAYLCESTDLSAPEAKIKLKYLQENGVLATDWKQLLNGGGSYVLTGSNQLGIDNFLSKLVEKNEWAKKLGLGEMFNTPLKNIENTNQVITQSKDAQIISLALENQGIVSASSVCVKLNISIEEAQKRLEDLRQKQIFISEVNQNGGLVYRLLDV